MHDLGEDESSLEFHYAFFRQDILGFHGTLYHTSKRKEHHTLAIFTNLGLTWYIEFFALAKFHICTLFLPEGTSFPSWITNGNRSIILHSELHHI